MVALVIQLWGPTGDCAMCGDEGHMAHCVGWYEGPVLQDPGEQIQLPNGEIANVGGRTICKTCYDGFYAL